MEKRVPGRPTRAAGGVGRHKIVEGIREALRRDHSLDTSRKSLALAVGITPALITYYFPESGALLEEVALPVIEAHRIELHRIANRTTGEGEKLRDIVSVLHLLYGRDRRLFAIYKDFENRFPDDYAETATMTAILSAFFGGAGDADPVSFEAIVLQGAVRSMCELAARVNAERDLSDQGESSPSLWLDRLCGIFRGPRGLLASSTVPALAM